LGKGAREAKDLVGHGLSQDDLLRANAAKHQDFGTERPISRRSPQSLRENQRGRRTAKKLTPEEKSDSPAPGGEDLQGEVARLQSALSEAKAEQLRRDLLVDTWLNKEREEHTKNLKEVEENCVSLQMDSDRWREEAQQNLDKAVTAEAASEELRAELRQTQGELEDLRKLATREGSFGQLTVDPDSLEQIMPTDCQAETDQTPTQLMGNSRDTEEGAVVDLEALQLAATELTSEGYDLRSLISLVQRIPQATQQSAEAEATPPPHQIAEDPEGWQDTWSKPRKRSTKTSWPTWGSYSWAGSSQQSSTPSKHRARGGAF